MSAAEDPGPIVFKGRVARHFQRLLDLLHAEGLTWLTVDDVIENLGAIGDWRTMRITPREVVSIPEGTTTVRERDAGDTRLDLLGLCAATGWPLPMPDGGRDHTTPAAWALRDARNRLIAAMAADSRGQGATANTIASRAAPAQSRPTTLKDLAGELLRLDVADALGDLHEEVPLRYDVKESERAVGLQALWLDEPEAERTRALDAVQHALDQSGLAVRDPASGSPASVRSLTEPKATVYIVRP
ncbi:hypothetical protein [Streptomyces lasiicapitis]|uniref:ESX secretion-associated protein EspG n=1 Tax=Streptomyces lasiicapitis TaxID=1923961 RepID=A0ABQ2MUB4_9ACTN|nr:hypothetical protein [Streptomyces lasiicapitis]GGO58944.1 hypothetical protein GCM10012286_79410 [Streptomyces lasiicapitis]